MWYLYLYLFIVTWWKGKKLCGPCPCRPSRCCPSQSVSHSGGEWGMQSFSHCVPSDAKTTVKRSFFWPVKIVSNTGRALLGWMQLDATFWGTGVLPHNYSVISNIFPMSCLPPVVNFPANSLPAIHIRLEKSELRSVIWAFQLMLFIIIFIMEKQLKQFFWIEFLMRAQMHVASYPINSGGIFQLWAFTRNHKNKSIMIILKTEGHMHAMAMFLWSLRKLVVIITSDGCLSIWTLSWKHSVSGRWCMCVCTMYTDICQK